MIIQRSSSLERSGKLHRTLPSVRTILAYNPDANREELSKRILEQFKKAKINLEIDQFESSTSGQDPYYIRTRSIFLIVLFCCNCVN